MHGPDDIISIALAANHRYAPGLKATLASMVLSAKDTSRLRVHVLADGLEPADEQELADLARRLGLTRAIEFHRPDMAPVRARFQPYRGAHTAFLRLFLCEFLEEDWVIYADVDTLWFRDVADLWKERDEAASVLWSRDVPWVARGVKEYSRPWFPDFDESRYACSGVMLMNLRRMRATRFVDQCAAFVEKWGTPPFVDQDIIAYVCRADAKLLDQRWDCMMPDPLAPQGVVLHFNGLGARFDEPFGGWRPQHAIWYRFYYDRVKDTPDRAVCGPLKRLVFALMGAFYPNRTVLQTFFGWRGLETVDQLHRQLFFAWLRLRMGRLESRVFPLSARKTR